MNLDEKVIAIVGGTSGFGLSAAQACIAAGARVVVAGRDDEHVAEARGFLGDSVPVLTGDAASPDLVKQTVARAVEAYGHLDGLYHVAGGSGRRYGDGPLHECSDEGWQKTLGLNLDSVFFSNRAALQQFLRQNRGGSIVNLSSVLGWSPSPSFFATHAYATAKAGIVGLSTALAAHYAPENIRVNVIAPALSDTPMATRALENRQIMDFVRTKQPLDGGRAIQPSDVDGAVVYLLSDAARMITGQVLSIDGGWTVTEGHTKENPE